MEWLNCQQLSQQSRFSHNVFFVIFTHPKFHNSFKRTWGFDYEQVGMEVGNTWAEPCNWVLLDEGDIEDS